MYYYLLLFIFRNTILQFKKKKSIDIESLITYRVQVKQLGQFLKPTRTGRIPKTGFKMHSCLENDYVHIKAHTLSSRNMHSKMKS